METLADKIKKHPDITPKKSVDQPVTSNDRSSVAPLEENAVVRPEYNLAKWADKIFLPHQSKRLGQIRTIPEQPQLFRDPSENPQIDPLRIVITPEMNGQTGSTTTWKILLGLFKLWEEKGKPEDGKYSFSVRELANVLALKVSGDLGDRVNRELRTLKTMTLTWEYSFEDDTGETVALVHEMNILSSRTYLAKRLRKKSDYFDALNAIVFNDDILKNLIAGKTIPVDFDTFIGIKSGTTLTLYSKLCTYLSHGTLREFRAQKLFRELELTGKKYESKRHRKTKLQELVAALDGKKMFNGTLSLDLRETSDGEDWKLVAKRIGKKAPVIAMKPANHSDVVKLLTADIIAMIGQEDHAANWRKLALTYPENLIRQALSEYKADIDQSTVENTGKVFNAIVHRLAHQHGHDWIKPCGKDCRFRL